MVYILRGYHCNDRMVVGFTTTYAISVYHNSSCEFESCSWRSVFDTILCDKVCQWLVAGRWISLFYNRLGGTSERICKRKQFCVWNVLLYSSAENVKRDSTYIIQNQIRKRNWESGIQPTCTQYPPPKRKMPHFSKQVEFGWYLPISI